MTARERLDAVEARADAATDGPWRVLHVATPSTPTLDTPDLIAVTSDRLPDGYEVARVSTDYEDDPADVLIDAEFIAHARTDVPALVAALRAVLDLADAADTPPPKGPLGASHAVRTRALRDAIDTHLGGAS